MRVCHGRGLVCHGRGGRGVVAATAAEKIVPKLHAAARRRLRRNGAGFLGRKFSRVERATSILGKPTSKLVETTSNLIRMTFNYVKNVRRL